jgi:iron(III) transport system substrate-binding protein
MFLANGPTLTNELLPKGLIKNYVPETLLGGQASKDVIPQKLREPLLVHSIESKVVFYNFETYSKSPVDTLWDLTRPEWRGKVQMKDPLATEENMNFLQTIVQHADDMAKTYQQEFGEPIKLSPGCKNAGYEFILRLSKNKLVLTSSDGNASKAAGTPGQKEPPLTLSVSSSKLRDNTKGMKLAIAWDVKPKVGISKENYVVIANKAPHPNAAKLFIQWMLGDNKGGKGMKPWFVEGQWASRSDVKPPIDITLKDLDNYTWFIDYKFVYDNGLAVRDFWLGL